MQATDRLADTVHWLRYAKEDLIAVEARYPSDIPEATNADTSKAVEQARAIWTSISIALAQHGYHAEQD